MDGDGDGDGFTCTNYTGCLAACPPARLPLPRCAAGLKIKCLLAAKIKVAFRVAIWVNRTVVYGRRDVVVAGDRPLINSSASGRPVWLGKSFVKFIATDTGRERKPEIICIPGVAALHPSPGSSFIPSSGW